MPGTATPNIVFLPGGPGGGAFGYAPPAGGAAGLAARPRSWLRPGVGAPGGVGAIPSMVWAIFAPAPAPGVAPVGFPGSGAGAGIGAGAGAIPTMVCFNLGAAGEAGAGGAAGGTPSMVCWKGDAGGLPPAADGAAPGAGSVAAPGPAPGAPGVAGGTPSMVCAKAGAPGAAGLPAAAGDSGKGAEAGVGRTGSGAEDPGEGGATPIMVCFEATGLARRGAASCHWGPAPACGDAGCGAAADFSSAPHAEQVESPGAFRVPHLRQATIPTTIYPQRGVVALTSHGFCANGVPGQTMQRCKVFVQQRAHPIWGEGSCMLQSAIPPAQV